MHLPSFLLLATTASTLVSARVDRLPSAHRQFARAAAAEPEPYRLFGAKSSASSGSSSPFVKRDDGPTFARIGDAVNEVATALKLEMPPVVQLSTLNGSSSAKQNNAKKTQKKNQVCRKKTAEEKRKSRAAKAKAQKKEAAGNTQDQQLNVEYEPEEKQAKAHAAVSSSSSSSNNNDKSSDSSSHKSESSSSDDSSNGKIADILKPVRSLIGFSADNCGESGATDEFPNGSESWLNCGISKGNPSGKWQPPKGVTIDHITTVSIEHALATNSVWEPCKPFIPLFERIGKETNLPAILLASFALQESTCNPHVLGDNNGAFGLMQITQDKCNGMDAKGCSDPEYNVRTAAEYFNKEMSNRGGEFLEALGAYNGWYPGLSFSGATAAAYGDCCVCQQNLDYLHQMTNGWLMGKTGYEMGSYKNLAVCHD